MNRLAEILTLKREEIERLRPYAAKLHQQALERTDFRNFRAALKRSDGKVAVIAEVKKASPSAGIIAESFDPVAIAKNYQHAGAAAISVLTDGRFFGGALNDLSDVARAVSLPVLRKDFIMEEIQIAESATAGADAILLIVAALEQKQFMALLTAARRYRLDVLAEVHNLEELKRAIEAEAEIIGINNRDLKSFQVDLKVTESLSENVPDNHVVVSESGFKTPADVARVKAWGVDAVLIGEALMRGQLAIAELQ
jgi:indole-3-glycerol phosphate synthase